MRHLKNLIHILKSSYKPPSYRPTGWELLDATYIWIELFVKESLNEKQGTLIFDGWSDMHNEPSTAAYIQADSESFIVDVEATRATKKKL